MKHVRVAKRYALALFKSAKLDQSLDRVRQDAELIVNTITSAKDLKAVLRSPVIQSWKKKGLLFEAFEGKISDLTKAFLGILCSKNREDITEEIFLQFFELYNIEFGFVQITVSSAVALDANERAAIEQGVHQRVQRKPIAQYVVDPSLKGGLMIQIGDQMLDSSLKTQLHRLHDSLIRDGVRAALN